MYRYRCPVLPTYETEKRLHHIGQIGEVLSARGYRFETTRGVKPHQWRNTYERVMVYGRFGSCRFDALWGYGGSGPQLTVDILIHTGLDRLVAEFVAFETPRRAKDMGNDWTLEYNRNGTVTYVTPNVKSILGVEKKLTVKVAA